MGSLTDLPPPPPCANYGGGRETILGTLVDSETKFRSTFKAISTQRVRCRKLGRGIPTHFDTGPKTAPSARLNRRLSKSSAALVSLTSMFSNLMVIRGPSGSGPLRGLINGSAVARHVFCAAAAYLFPPLSVSRDCTKTHFERNAHLSLLSLSLSLLSGGNQTFSFPLPLSPSRLISQDLLFSFLAFPPLSRRGPSIRGHTKEYIQAT